MEKTIDEKNEVTPEKIFQTYSAHMGTRVLVAKAALASPRGMEILLNGLVALTFLMKSSEVCQITPLEEKFLVMDNLHTWVIGYRLQT